MRALWASHYEEVLRFAMRRADAELATEVAADTFLVAWRRRSRVPEGAERAWLLGVARKTLANGRRSERRRGALVERLTRNPALPAPDPAERGDSSDLAAAFRTLSAKDREALSLVAWEGLSPAHAAQALGCGEVAFRVRLHRARTRLKAALDAGSVAVKTDEQPSGGVS